MLNSLSKILVLSGFSLVFAAVASASPPIPCSDESGKAFVTILKGVPSSSQATLIFASSSHPAVVSMKEQLQQHSAGCYYVTHLTTTFDHPYFGIVLNEDDSFGQWNTRCAGFAHSYASATYQAEGDPEVKLRCKVPGAFNTAH